MNAKKCDRCGKYFDETEEYLGIEITHIVDNWRSRGFEFDLCKDCQQDFKNFTNNYKKEG